MMLRNVSYLVLILGTIFVLFILGRIDGNKDFIDEDEKKGFGDR